jgi:hypothetical protein
MKSAIRFFNESCDGISKVEEHFEYENRIVMAAANSRMGVIPGE